MDSVLDDVLNAIDLWLSEIETTEKLSKIKTRINRAILRIQYEGQNSLIDMARLIHISDIWVSLLELLTSSNNKQLVVMKILELFNYGQITIELTYTLINNIYSA